MSESEVPLEKDSENQSVDDLDGIENIFEDDLHGSQEIGDPEKDPLLWVQSQISCGVNPRAIIRQLIPHSNLPDDVPEFSVWKLIFEIITEPSPRQRLQNIYSIEHVIHLIRECRNIIVLTGAGVSVSCGIPDFRSQDGIYARLSEDFPDLPDSQSMFDIHYFRSNPSPFFKFAKEIYPGQFTPSLSHRFINHLEESGRLLCNYTQNIDTLEKEAGIENVVYCHGSFATASCMNCKYKVNADDIKQDIFEKRIPLCSQCTPVDEGNTNVIKPDIVFFGEPLPDEFHKQIEKDKLKADLLIVIGSSLKVRPVALIPSLLKPDVPQILINREPLSHMQFDVELYGNCDNVINELCNHLGTEWSHIRESFEPTPVDKEEYKINICLSSGFVAGDENTVMSNNTHLSHGVDNSNKLNIIEENSNFVTLKGDDQIFGIYNTCSVCRLVVTNDTITCNEDDRGIALEQRCNCTETEYSESKKKKKNGDNEKQKKAKNIFYFPLLPNAYVFHGAELKCSSDSESKSSGEDHHHSITENIVDNGIETGCSSSKMVTSDICNNVGNTNADFIATQEYFSG